MAEEAELANICDSGFPVSARRRYNRQLPSSRTTRYERRAEVEIARQQLADTVIRAPFDGAIQVRRASPGEYMIAGTPLVTIVQTDPLRLRVEAPERRPERSPSPRTHPMLPPRWWGSRARCWRTPPRSTCI